MTFLYILFHFIKIVPISICDVQYALSKDSASYLLTPF